MNLVFLRSTFLATSAFVVCPSHAFVETLNSYWYAAETLYRQVRKTNVLTKEHLDAQTKNRICLTAMSTSKWRARPVDMYEISPDQIRSKNPKLFERLYELRDGHLPVYTNATRPMNVYAKQADQESFVEDLFVCVNEHTNERGNVIEYHEHYISKEYNVNIMSDASSNYVAARFLFGSFKGAWNSTTRMVIYGMVEEPARALLGSNVDWSMRIILSMFASYIANQEHTADTLRMNVERLYLLRRSKNRPANKEADDPICKLSETSRYRLCSLVSNAQYFHGKGNFMENIVVTGGSSCDKYEVTFREDEVRAEADGNHYAEWMIVCNPSSSFFFRNEVYLVSRGYNHRANTALTANDVFVYRQQKIGSHIRQYLVNVFTNVRY